MGKFFGICCDIGVRERNYVTVTRTIFCRMDNLIPVRVYKRQTFAQIIGVFHIQFYPLSFQERVRVRFEGHGVSKPHPAYGLTAVKQTSSVAIARPLLLLLG